MIRRRSARSLVREGGEHEDTGLEYSDIRYMRRHDRRGQYHGEHSEASAGDDDENKAQVLARRDSTPSEIAAREDYDGRSITSSSRSEDQERRRRHRARRGLSPDSSGLSPSAFARKYYGEGSRSPSPDHNEGYKDGRVHSQHRGIDVNPDKLGPIYWDNSTQAYTDAYHEIFPTTHEATWIAESDKANEIQAKVDSIVWDLAGRDMIIHEYVYKSIVYAICVDEFGTISGVSQGGNHVHFTIGGWNQDHWAERMKYISPFGEGLQCPSSCPLREYTQQPLDPALPLDPDLPTASHKDASTRLYGRIERWQSRILILEPGVFGSELKARLMVADLVCVPGVVFHETQQLVAFTALSYTWGAAAFPRLVSINDVPFPITENLFAFLQRVRSDTDGAHLWVDAICINQLDLDEKATQVQNMLTIYEKARDVLVWLGEEGEYTKLALTYLRWAHTMMKEHLKLEVHLRSDQFAVVDPRNIWHPPKCAQHFSSVLSGLEDLCSRDWVRRIWVRQEVWAANKIKIRCGSTSFDWDDFLVAPGVHLRSKETNRIVPQITNEHTSCLRYLRRRKKTTNEPVSDEEPTMLRDETCELLVLLNECVSCQFTVQHDLIYSLLGMASVPRPQLFFRHVPEVQIEVNYQQPVEFLFSELAMSLMHATGPHSILATATRLNEHTQLDLPTWVPDFRNGHHCEFQGHMSKYAPHLYTTRFDRTMRDTPGFQKDRELLDRFRQLNAKATLIDLLLEGLCVGELDSEPSRMEPYWQVCLIVTGDDDGYGDTAYNARRQRHQEYHRGSKPMTYHLHEWFIDVHDQKHDKEDDSRASQRHSKLSSFRAYSKILATLSVPVSARKGDLLVIVPLLATPLILRRLPGSRLISMLDIVPTQ